MNMKLRFKGFTLIELIVVIGIIAILAAIVIVAVNPARQFAQARNSQRTSDVRAIVNAINQYAADNGGTALTGFTNCVVTGGAVTLADINTMRADAAYLTKYDIGTPAGGVQVTGTGAAGTLASYLVPNYISALPKDPSTLAAADGAGYGVCLLNNRTTAYSHKATANSELNRTITVTQ